MIAGVGVPDSPLITEAIEYARTLYDPYLFNHAMRSWLFAAKIGAVERHRLRPRSRRGRHASSTTSASSPAVSGPNRFEVNGAAAARSFVKERGISDRRAQLIWDLVALNSTVSIALHKEPEVAVGTMGIGLDYGGFWLRADPVSGHDRHSPGIPASEDERQFAETCCRLVSAKPETSSDNFLRDFGERFVPGYKPVSTVDLLMNAPFEE